MSDKCNACTGCMGGCALFIMYICYLVFGGMALHGSYSDASGCGWTLWGTVVAGLIYTPIGMFVAIMSGPGMLVIIKEGNSNSSVDGCLGTCAFITTHLINAVIATFIAIGLWSEDCVPEDSDLYRYGEAIFWMSVMTSGISIILTIIALFMKCFCPAKLDSLV